jgi:alginate O-acetyltransferase complex protein AlgI
MLFNSIDFLIFFPIVVFLYFALNHKWRWLLLLSASYYFYMCWRVEYIFLILASTLIDYWVGLKMSLIAHKDKKKRKPFLYLSLLINLGLLFSFKYYYFFSDSFHFLFAQFNIFFHFPDLKVLLPVGISFYTFQTLSYSLDIYHGRTKPEKHLGLFALYVSFFPQLVAGPIERSTSLLPQFREKKYFSYSLMSSGLRLMAWGFFKKVVIADRIAVYVNQVYGNIDNYSGICVLLAIVLFMIQVYCDFSGYSDIAIGAARTMGYKLMLNFNRPFISKSLSEFWNRWHISLISWFKDYVFFAMPIGRNKKLYMARAYFNLIVIFFLSGLWHGAHWTFAVWGILNGLYIVIEKQTLKLRKKMAVILFLHHFPSLQNMFSMVFTSFAAAFMAVFFRAENIHHAFKTYANAFDFSYFGSSFFIIFRNNDLMLGIILIILMLFTEYIHQKYNVSKILYRMPLLLRWTVYVIFLTFIIIFGIFNQEEFFYFQF